MVGDLFVQLGNLLLVDLNPLAELEVLFYQILDVVVVFLYPQLFGLLQFLQETIPVIVTFLLGLVKVVHGLIFFESGDVFIDIVDEILVADPLSLLLALLLEGVLDGGLIVSIFVILGGVIVVFAGFVGDS